MKTYRTSEIAHIIGIHPNTLRLYEELELIPKPKRKENGYRVFTDFHLEQIWHARIALKVEVLQNGLRKQAITIIKTSAHGNFEEAISLTEHYLQQVSDEQRNAEEAIAITEKLLSGNSQDTGTMFLTRKEAAGLDARARRDVWKSLSVLKERGITILLTSHFMDEVENLCDKIMILKKGKNIFCGTVQEALASSPYEKFEDAYLWYTDEDDKNESI